MNIKLVKLLIILSASLLLLVLAEGLYGNYRQRHLADLISSVPPQDYHGDELPGINLAKQPEESFTDLVARPLFIQGRRPVDEPAPVAQQSATKPDSFDWQLNGIYSTKKTVSAFFSRLKPKTSAKENYRKITIGDDLDGWKLTEIKKDMVILKQDGNDKTLQLRKPKLKSLPQKVNTPPPPVPAAAPAPSGTPPSPFQATVPIKAPPPVPGTDTPKAPSKE